MASGEAVGVRVYMCCSGGIFIGFLDRWFEKLHTIWVSECECVLFARQSSANACDRKRKREKERVNSISGKAMKIPFGALSHRSLL